jgi:polygalacturonase
MKIVLWRVLLVLFTGIVVDAAGEERAVITSYPLPFIYERSALFSLQAEGTDIPVILYNGKYDYAHFSMTTGTALITITVPGVTAVSSCSISPLRAGISGSISGNRVSFTLHKDQYLIVKLDGLRELVIAADAVETDKPLPAGAGIFNVRAAAYGAKGSGNKLATKAIQKAIDAAAGYKGGNGIVYVPAGVYPVGNLELKSNTSLYLEGGAVLLFTGKPKDYAVHSHKKSQKRNITWWIYTDSGAHHIKLYGRGTLDGNGKYATEVHRFGNNILALMNTSHFTLDGPVIRNSGAWAVIPTRSHDLVFKNFKLFNRFDMGENDGIDVIESQNVLVQHAIGIALDDPFSCKTWNQATDIAIQWRGQPEPLRNVVFEDLLSWTYCYAYKIGQGVMQPQSDIIFRNCVVYDAAVGIGIHHKWGTAGVSNVLFDHIDIEKLSYQNDDHRTWGVFLVQNGDKKGGGPVSHVTVSNITVRDKGRSPGKIRGSNGEHLISDLSFSHIIMPAMTAPAASLLQMNMTDTANCSHIRVIP